MKTNTIKKAALKASVIPLTAAALMLGGCGSSVKVTSEQNDLIAEYIGGTLMKYSYENEWKYIKVNDNITNFERPTGSAATGSQQTTQSGQKATQSATQHGQKPTSSATTGSMSDLAAAMNLDGITISYSGYTLGKNYPEESDTLSVRAISGKNIVAVEFNLKNTTGSNIVCNTAPLGVVMKLSVNGGAGVAEYATMLKNDLNTLSDVTIAPGEDYKAVVLFMISEKNAEEVSSLTLSLSGQGVSPVKITLK